MTDTTNTTDAREFDEELFEPWADGRVHLRLNGKDYWLRRPKFKELRLIRESLKPLAEDERNENERLRAIAKRRVDEGPKTPNGEPILDDSAQPLLADATAEEAAETGAITDARNERMLRWMHREVLVRLAQPGYPDADDEWENLPLWMASTAVVQDLNEHWSSVPRRPGSR